MIVVVPTASSVLPSVEYGVTSTYHWPQFDKNVTDQFGENPVEGFTEVTGPSLFKKAIGLSSTDEEVLIGAHIKIYLYSLSDP